MWIPINSGRHVQLSVPSWESKINPINTSQIKHQFCVEVLFFLLVTNIKNRRRWQSLIIHTAIGMPVCRRNVRCIHPTHSSLQISPIEQFIVLTWLIRIYYVIRAYNFIVDNRSGKVQWRRVALSDPYYLYRNAWPGQLILRLVRILPKINNSRIRFSHSPILPKSSSRRGTGRKKRIWAHRETEKRENARGSNCCFC